ncbi:MAG: peptide-methionine (S)-S-oxide reductase MsrA [Crocinitomix sp.]|nr:peptide-methionine (S)-S-oxide reductase MsrA [Crocinitomix sp.]
MSKIETATFGGGCFWCVEAVIQRLKGIIALEPGYTGGIAPGKPTYREICSGLTGHAEVIQVKFDSDILSFRDLLNVFMTTHDPTTLNRQGADRGTQYRSVIYYHDEAQKNTATDVVDALATVYDNTIVTEISELGIYYTAEDYHHNYYNNNENAAYCSAVISPKINKLKAKFAHLLAN